MCRVSWRESRGREARAGGSEGTKQNDRNQGRRPGAQKRHDATGSDTFSIPNEVRPHRVADDRAGHPYPRRNEVGARRGRDRRVGGSRRTRRRRVPTLKTADAMTSHPYLGRHGVRHVQHSERSQTPSRRPCLDKGGGGCSVGGVSLRMRIHYPRVASSR